MALAAIADRTRTTHGWAATFVLLGLAWGFLVAETAAADRPAPLRLTHDGLDKQRPAWSPDGKRLTFTRIESDSAHIWQYIVEIGSFDKPKRVTDRKAPEFAGVFSPDGNGNRMLLSIVTLSGTQGNVDIALLNADGSDLKTVAGDKNNKLWHQEWPTWSPDGKRFAFSSTQDGNQEIYTAKVDGSDLVRLTQSPGIDSHPCWSPDGQRIAFTTDRFGGYEIATVKPDGTGLARITHSPGLDDYASLSPDGERIAFVSNRDGNYEIYVARADGRDPVNVSSHPMRDAFPTWTADGHAVTFVSNRAGGDDLYTVTITP